MRPLNVADATPADLPGNRFAWDVMNYGPVRVLILDVTDSGIAQARNSDGEFMAFTVSEFMADWRNGKVRQIAPFPVVNVEQAREWAKMLYGPTADAEFDPSKPPSTNPYRLTVPHDDPEFGRVTVGIGRSWADALTDAFILASILEDMAKVRILMPLESRTDIPGGESAV